MDAQSSTASVLAAAAELEAGGRALDAIKLLHESNRRRPDGALERMLVRLRREAFKRGGDRPPLDSTPLVAIAAHPTVGLASVRRDELTTHHVRSGILSSGALYVPGLLDAGQVDRMRDAIDCAFEARRLAAGQGARDEHKEWYDLVTGVPAARGFLGDEALLTGDSPRALFQLMETFYELGIDRLLSDYFGEPAGLSFQKCTLRRAKPSKPGSWHQDGAFLGTDIRSLNIWITLSHCGRDAPGLEIVPRRVEGILQTGAYFDWDVSEDVIQATFPGVSPLVPELQPGDTLFFDHLFLHRTFRTETMANPRYAIENWFFAPSAYPAKGNGLVV